MAFPDGWSHKWPIAINADSVISSPVTDWPCLITDAHFPEGAWALMQATGADLRFSLDADGATELYYDAPRLSVAGESAHLYVRVPSLASTADTTIYGWVGNGSATAPSATWMRNTYSNAFAACYHFEEAIWNGTTGEVKNAVADSNHGTSGGGAVVTTGLLGSGGGDFDPEGETGGGLARVVLPTRGPGAYWSNTYIGGTYVLAPRAGTGSCWFRQPTGRAVVNGVLFGCGNDSSGYYVELQTTGIVLMVGGGSAYKVWLTALGSYADDAWHHVACSFRNVDGDWQAALYVDGLKAVDWTACPTAVNGSYNDATVIGCRNWTWAGNFSSGTDALIDEVEFTTYGTYRSDDWIAAVYANGSAPATFATAGELVAVGGASRAYFGTRNLGAQLLRRTGL